MKPPRWSDVELQMLEQLANDQPPDRLIATYNRWAARQGLSTRSRSAIHARLSRSGISTRAACGEWISCGYIRQALQVGANTSQRWEIRHAIPCHRDGRGSRFFRRADLQQAAREKPAIFGGISADRLFLLLEDRELADAVAAAHPRRAMDPKPVQAIETGWRYPSVRAAAARVYVTRQSIQHAIRTGGTAAGYHWIYA